MRRAKLTLLVLVLLVSVASLVGMQTTVTVLELNTEISGMAYEGLDDGEYSMRFEIYDAEIGGVKLWPAADSMEEHPVIAVRRGDFDALLGSEGCPITEAVLVNPLVFAQVWVCRPAGPFCPAYEILPFRLPLETGLAMEWVPVDDVDEAVPLKSVGTPTDPPVATVEMPSMTIGTLNDHTHWSETWSGFGTGLALVSAGSERNQPALLGLSEVDTGIGLWGESTGVQGYGGFFTSLHGVGLAVGRAGTDAVRILAATDDGLEIHDAGLAPSHLTTEDLELGMTSNGIDILGARDLGLWVGYAGSHGLGIGVSQEHGLWVIDAGSDAIRVEMASGSGLSIGWAELAGVTVQRAGTSGLVVESAGLYGVYASSLGPAGVLGIASAESGRAIGVHGQCASPDGYGVYSDGNAHVAGELTWQPKTSYVSIPPAAFHPHERDTNHTNTGGALSSSPPEVEGTDLFLAPVLLPHGAEVVRLEMRMYSVGKSEGAEGLRAQSRHVTSLDLIRSDFADRLLAMAEVEEGPVAAKTSTVFSTAAIAEAKIDNSRFTYFLGLRLRESTTFLGAVIEYKIAGPY